MMYPLTSTTTTLRADQQDCQKGLVEDHSGGSGLETLRPSGVLVGLRPGEVCPFEVCLFEIHRWSDLVHPGGYQVERKEGG